MTDLLLILACLVGVVGCLLCRGPGPLAPEPWEIELRDDFRA
jgi:hypothetical protein